MWSKHCICIKINSYDFVLTAFILYSDRTIRSVEEHIKESILKEVMSMKSSKGLHIDLSTLEIKRMLDTDVLRTASFVRERDQVGDQRSCASSGSHRTHQ